MEVKINREIRYYTESMFFGLSLRQFIFSALACAVAVVIYFLLKRLPRISAERLHGYGSDPSGLPGRASQTG